MAIIAKVLDDEHNHFILRRITSWWIRDNSSTSSDTIDNNFAVQRDTRVLFPDELRTSAPIVQAAETRAAKVISRKFPLQSPFTCLQPAFTTNGRSSTADFFVGT